MCLLVHESESLYFRIHLFCQPIAGLGLNPAVACGVARLIPSNDVEIDILAQNYIRPTHQKYSMLKVHVPEY